MVFPLPRTFLERRSRQILLGENREGTVSVEIKESTDDGLGFIELLRPGTTSEYDFAPSIGLLFVSDQDPSVRTWITFDAWNESPHRYFEFRRDETPAGYKKRAAHWDMLCEKLFERVKRERDQLELACLVVASLMA